MGPSRLGRKCSILPLFPLCMKNRKPGFVHGVESWGAKRCSVSVLAFSRYSRSTSRSSSMEGPPVSKHGSCSFTRPNRSVTHARIPARRFSPIPAVRINRSSWAAIFSSSSVSISNSGWRRLVRVFPIPGMVARRLTGSASPRTGQAWEGLPLWITSRMGQARLSPMPGKCVSPSHPSAWKMVSIGRSNCSSVWAARR
jgi:hypothetical protein